MVSKKLWCVMVSKKLWCVMVSKKLYSHDYCISFMSKQCIALSLRTPAVQAGKRDAAQCAALHIELQ